MKTLKFTSILGSGIAAALVVSAIDTAPATAEGFYKGKRIKVIIRSSAGGGYDYYARLVAKYMPRHIPGKPTAIAVNMPGASGVVATNYMMNRAKRDGTEIAAVSREQATQQRAGGKGIKYDIRKMPTIGSIASTTAVMILHKDHPANSLKELRAVKTTTKFGAQGKGGGAFQRPMLLKMDGYKIQIITGYTGTEERVLAMIRGDIGGGSGSYDSLASYIKDNNFKIIAYLGNKLPELKGVPNIDEGLTLKRTLQLSALLQAPLAAGRPFITTPGVPADRVKILRTAFKKALSDPGLVADAKRAKRKISWTDPNVMTKLYSEILDTPDDVIATFKTVMLGKSKGGGLVKHAGKVSGIKREGRQVTISYKGKGVTAKISGSRTAVKINGKKAKRKAIKVGMTCTFNYPGPGKEAKSVECKG